MLTIPTVSNAPSTLTLLPSTLATTTTDLVSTRQTSQALPAPLSNPPLNNDPQTPPPPVPVVIEAVPAEADMQGTTGASAGNVAANGPSATFLAQLFSQTEDQSGLALAATYARFAPAPEYNTFVAYSLIKYKPSDAGIPQYNSRSAPQDSAPPQNDNAVPEPPANDYQAYNNTQSRNQVNLSPEEPQLIVAG